MRVSCHGDVCLHHVWDHVSTYRLMTRVRAWRMIIKVSQVGRFVSTLSQLFFRPFFNATNRGVCFVPVTAVTIYSRSPSKTPRAATRFDRSTRSRGGMFLFLSIFYCHGNARLRLIVRSSVPHKEGTINRGNVKSFLS